MDKETLISDTTGLNLAKLQKLQQRPAPFAPGAATFWDDPYISEQMQAAHLDPKSDAASRRPQIIDHEVAWLIVALDLKEGDELLDLGCGPGLYTSRLARRGLVVTGGDYARRSIDNAHTEAEKQDLAVNYLCQDYLTLDFKAQFDAVLLVNGDFGVLDQERRVQLLKVIHRALKPDGRFALDVFTRAHRIHYGVSNQWYVAEQGFWRPGKHIVLEEGFDYPQDNLYLNQYVIIEADGTLTTYRNWFQDYTPETITATLKQGGFSVEYLGGNLRGGAFTRGSEWVGVIARKSPPPLPDRG